MGIVAYYWGALSPRLRRSLATGVKKMAFTADVRRPVAAYENKIVIKDTLTKSWHTLQVLDYPCPLNLVSVSPGGTMVACGTSTGVIWLWTSIMNCWKKRVAPSGGPNKIGHAIDNLEFSATGLSLTCTHDTYTGGVSKTQPLNEFGTSWNFYRDLCQPVG